MLFLMRASSSFLLNFTVSHLCLSSFILQNTTKS